MAGGDGLPRRTHTARSRRGLQCGGPGEPAPEHPRLPRRGRDRQVHTLPQDRGVAGRQRASPRAVGVAGAPRDADPARPDRPRSCGWHRLRACHPHDPPRRRRPRPADARLRPRPAPVLGAQPPGRTDRGLPTPGRAAEPLQRRGRPAPADTVRPQRRRPGPAPARHRRGRTGPRSRCAHQGVTRTAPIRTRPRRLLPSDRPTRGRARPGSPQLLPAPSGLGPGPTPGRQQRTARDPAGHVRGHR